MARCLVTGAAGFIGSHLCDSLVERGHEVWGVDDLSGGHISNIPTSCARFISSVTNERDVESAFQLCRPEYVFHLAAFAAEGLSHHIRRFIYNNVVIGSVNLINAAVRHGCKGFIFTSSAAVYGDTPSPFFEDTTRLRPIDPYGIAKMAVEQDLKCAHELWGLPYMIFRPHNVYGERQNCADPYRNVIGIFMRQALSGEPLTIFGDGEQTRAFTHVSDVAPVMAEAIEKKQAWNQIFNIGAARCYSINELALGVQQAMHVKHDTIHLPARHETTEVMCAHSKIRNMLGFTSKIRLDEGLQRMAAWVRANPPQKLTPFAEIEVEKDMPPSWRMLCTQS